MDDIKSSLAAIAESHGLSFDFNEAGGCTLPLVDDRYLQLQIRANLGELDLVATLGTVPEELRPAVFPTLLAANYYWDETVGATLSWHPEIEQVMLAFPVPIATTDEATLQTIFDNFLKLQDQWATRLVHEIEEAQTLFDAAQAAAAEEAEAEAEPIPAEEPVQKFFG